MKSIDDLFNETTTSRPVNRRYPKKTVDEYVSRLKRVIVLKDEECKVMPTLSALSLHFKKELGMDVTPPSIGNHIAALRKDGFIWRR